MKKSIWIMCLLVFTISGLILDDLKDLPVYIIAGIIMAIILNTIANKRK